MPLCDCCHSSSCSRFSQRVSATLSLELSRATKGSRFAVCPSSVPWNARPDASRGGYVGGARTTFAPSGALQGDGLR
jgi:hypothetical protein